MVTILKIWEFIKKNWMIILVVPALIVIFVQGIKWYVKMLVDRNDNTDDILHKTDVKYKTDSDLVSNEEKKLLDNNKKLKDDVLASINSGDPSAADVMNSAVGIKGEGEKK